MRAAFPAIDDFRYYTALFLGELSYEQTMRAHLQDLARSLACRGLREIQLQKLDQARHSGDVLQANWRELRRTIEDELATPARPSHFDIRLQMFEGLPYDVEELESVQPLPQASEATRIFRSIFLDRGLLEITAAVGAIEEWYVPVAARLEARYLELGYTSRQVETYTLHKEADVAHSTAAFRFIEAHATEEDHASLIDAVRAGFRSVLLYDEARYCAATDSKRDFAHYLEALR